MSNPSAIAGFTRAAGVALPLFALRGAEDLGTGTLLDLIPFIDWLARYGQRVNLKRFFQVTSVFLILFTIQLFIYAFHEFSEAGVVPGIDNAFWHAATEPYGPEGQYGEWLTYLMVLVPACWLAVAWWRDRGTPPRHAPRAA